VATSSCCCCYWWCCYDDDCTLHCHSQYPRALL